MSLVSTCWVSPVIRRTPGRTVVRGLRVPTRQPQLGTVPALPERVRRAAASLRGRLAALHTGQRLPKA